MNNDEKKELEEEYLDNESEGEVPSSDYSDFDDELDDEEEYPEEEYDQPSYSRNFSNGFKSGVKGKQDKKEESSNKQSSKLDDFKNGAKGQPSNVQNNKPNVRNKNVDEATKNKLNSRKEKTIRDYNSKNSSTVNQSTSKASSSLKKKSKEASSKAKKTAAKEKAKKATKEATKKVKQKAKQALASLLKKLAANPYFWIAIGILLLVLIFVILIVVLWAAIDGDESEEGNTTTGDIAYVAGYEECTSITVDGLGTYNLEDYVAGVIQHESYQDDGNEEALKAQAVAARTYAINYTNNCTSSISNSQGAQTFSTTPSEKAKAAANATAGQVLTHNGSVFSSQYDSFCYADKDCPDATKNSDGTYSVTYTKVPNGETHVVKLTDSVQYGRIVPGGGHARGMSQLVSYEMSKNGSSYKDILNFFYSDGVKISSITETAGATDASVATDIPTGVDDLKTRYWFTFDIDEYAAIEGSNSHLFGQCVWYAKHRAMDIINSSNLSQSEKDKRINSIKSVLGNGQDVVPNLDGSIFKKTNNIDSIQAPAIISWKHSTYGHVGIIEQISIDNSGNKTYYITDGGRKRDSSGNWYTVSKDNLWTVVNFWSTPNADKATVQSRWSGYTFNGAASLTG